MGIDKEKFLPVNGQAVCEFSRLRFGLCSVRNNGCALLAVYNALGLLGRKLPFGEILAAFSHWYRPRFFGIFPWEIRRFFRKRGVPLEACSGPADLEQRLKQGGVGVMTYWNSSRRFLGLRLPRLFRGAHTVALRYTQEGCLIYNPHSLKKAVGRCDGLETLFQRAIWISGCYLPEGNE